ncbi:MAG: T9SS type A sorting domain-containing protein [candidate division Zixibacteria bacterium]|nr:T9SS type A sorting domain-containing protein [candidate division Zixibacteria bacterium]
MKTDGDGMKKVLYSTALFIFLFLVSGSPVAQVILSGDITVHMDSIMTAIPGATPSGMYLQPGISSRALWHQMIADIMTENYAEAHDSALTINYRLVQFTDNASVPEQVYYILERTPESSSRYWGTFVFNPDARRRQLVIQSPHARYDRNTGYQGWRVFKTAGARAFFVNGIHRCNGETATPCDGTTTVCTDEAQAYRYSDQPHVVNSTFQITTEEMLAVIPDMIVVQPHGFTKGDDDPDIIMSNGTRYTPDGVDYMPALRDNLLLQDEELTFKIAHIDTDWIRLIARTNTQGRLLNGSPDPCGTYASAASGQFYHLEQAYSGLRNSEANWNKLVNAVVLTFPEDNPLAVDDDDPPVLPRSSQVYQNYPNPFNPSTVISYSLAERCDVRITIINTRGQKVQTLVHERQAPGRHQVAFNGSDLGSGVYFYTVAAGTELHTGKMVLLK